MNPDRTHRRGPLGAIAALALLITACGDDAPAGSFPEVRSSVPGSHVTAPEVFRVGREDGTGPEVFGLVSFVGVDRQNRVHVIDGLAQEVRLFDEEGRHIRTIGGRGEGPGETLRATGIGFPPDGSIHIWDVQQRRFAIYDSALSFQRSLRAELLPLSAAGWRGRSGEDGTLYVPTSTFEGLDPSRPETQNFQQIIQILRFGSDLASADTAATFSLPRTAFAGNFIVPFEPTGVNEFDPGGDAGQATLWFAPSARYRVLQLAIPWDTLRAFGLDTAPPAVTPAQLDSVSEAMPATPVRPALDRSLVPQVRPAIRLILHLGNQWVGVFPDLGDDTGRILDVFQPDGTLAARVELAVALRLTPRPWVHGTRLYGVTVDALDVPYVVAMDLSEVLGR